MKTYTDLYGEIISLPNLYKAYESAKRGKSKKFRIIEFEKDLHENLLELHFELLEKKYAPRPYKMFFVQDYKKRKILVPSFRDQIVHHALFLFLEQIYELSFIHDSYACRKGKGTHKAFSRLRKLMFKHKPSDYFMKCDISKYFYSIDQYVLKKIIKKKVNDDETLWLIYKIIDSHSEEQIPAHVENGSEKVRKKGLPIGNLTSQLFANIYLNELDFFVKHKLKIKHYVRYVDDFIIFGKDYSVLKKCLCEIQSYLHDSLFLRLENKKVQTNKVSFGIDFCGYVARKNYVRVRARNSRRYIKQFKKNIFLYNKGELSFSKIRASFASYKGHLEHTNSNKIRGRISLIYHRAKEQTVQRGGNWDDGSNAGLFYARLNNDATNTNTNIGFRCCRAPRRVDATSRSCSQSEVHFLLPSFMKTGAEMRQSMGAAASAMKREKEEKTSEKIIQSIKQNNRISAERLNKEIGINSRAVEMQLLKLKEEGKIKRIGPAKGGR